MLQINRKAPLTTIGSIMAFLVLTVLVSMVSPVTAAFADPTPAQTGEHSPEAAPARRKAYQAERQQREEAARLQAAKDLAARRKAYQAERQQREEAARLQAAKDLAARSQAAHK